MLFEVTVAKKTGNKAIDKEENLGTKIFQWNGKSYVEK